MSTKSLTKVENMVNTYNEKKVSIADLLCDRHQEDKLALYYENASGEKRTYTYGELSHLSKKFAQVLHNNGVEKGGYCSCFITKRSGDFNLSSWYMETRCSSSAIIYSFWT